MNEPDYLERLDKLWACSHPKLANAKPKELFSPDYVGRYRRLHEDLWWRIVRVHGTLHTLDQLKAFPFEHLYAPNEMEFWRLVVRNFLDMACILLHGLLSDESANAQTIPRFKNEVIRAPWLDDTKRQLLQRTLGERKFDKVADSIADRVRAIRHRRIAHRLRDKEGDAAKEQLAAVSLDELHRLFNAAHGLFGALCFGSAYATLAGDLMPCTVGGKPARTCLDEILDAVLRDSYFVNRPERRGHWWPLDRKHMDPKELELMNDLRKRVGLPEA